MDTISGTIHPHMYTGHTNEEERKDITRGQRKGESGEW
jgi:hypothetical protein